MIRKFTARAPPQTARGMTKPLGRGLGFPAKDQGLVPTEAVIMSDA